MVEVIDGESHRELTRRVHLACEHLGDGVRSLLSGRPGKQDGVDLVLPGVGLDDTADVQDHDHFLAFGVEGPGNPVDEVPFGECEFEVVFYATVCPFACIPADDDDGHIVRLSVILDAVGGYIHFSKLWATEEDTVDRSGQGAGRLVVGNMGIIEIDQGRVELEAGVLEPLLHVHHICFVDIAGTCAACDEID